MRTPRSVAAAVCLALTLAAPGAPAQVTELQPGARIRIVAPGSVAGRYVGTILARRGDSLVVGSPTSQPLTVPLASVTSLEVSRGKSRSLGAIAGIKWGTPIGFVLGALLLPAINDCRSCDRPTTAEVLSIYTLSGVLYGAGIGALVGREKWEPFDLAPRLHVGRRSGHTQFGVAFGL